MKKQTQSSSRYIDDLNNAVESIKTSPTYEAKDVFAWMRTWGTDQRKPFNEVVASVEKRL